MIKIIPVFVVVCFFVFPSGLTAKDNKGADLLVEKLDGKHVRGELIAVKDSSLLLLSESGADVSVDVQDIKVITVVKKSKAMLGAAIGFALGASCAIYGLSGEGGVLFRGYVFYSIIAGGAIALVGAGLGSIWGIDKTIEIEGKTDKEIQEILEKLSKKARVPDYD
jgi:hypothetical protein